MARWLLMRSALARRFAHGFLQSMSAGAEQLQQLGDIGRDAPGFIAGQERLGINMTLLLLLLLRTSVLRAPAPLRQWPGFFHAEGASFGRPFAWRNTQGRLERAPAKSVLGAVSCHSNVTISRALSCLFAL
jgi:hypothetical protein